MAPFVSEGLPPLYSNIKVHALDGTKTMCSTVDLDPNGLESGVDWDEYGKTDVAQFITNGSGSMIMDIQAVLRTSPTKNPEY
ncbi:hypothetical protein N7520_007177 [Penicillium odoratum]|uniref:uncharacterized protein n=1 Tax=Penicillium odoratum TaxID=1167516 RepID=UPI002547B052|nr:uncharacterized protein N7520_007177 [Penicillium odoratum]KAJ5760021.1 hypothetical protein N7520_007177 [Penicillium odoratum]